MNDVILSSLQICRNTLVEKLIAAKKEKQGFFSEERTIQSLLVDNKVLQIQKELVECDLAMSYVHNQKLEEKLATINDQMNK